MYFSTIPHESTHMPFTNLATTACYSSNCSMVCSSGYWLIGCVKRWIQPIMTILHITWCQTWLAFVSMYIKSCAPPRLPQLFFWTPHQENLLFTLVPPLLHLLPFPREWLATTVGKKGRFSAPAIIFWPSHIASSHVVIPHCHAIMKLSNVTPHGLALCDLPLFCVIKQPNHMATVQY